MPRLLVVLLVAGAAPADEPLHRRIDALVAKGVEAKHVSPPGDDAEFLRRVTLDLAGTIPTSAEVRAFFDDPSPDKRTKTIDALLAAPAYARTMSERFHVVLMERLGDHAGWAKYLEDAFAANRPWDAVSREILRASPAEDAPRAAAFWMAKRLENYGQNPVDYSALTRDVGRLFLGKDFRCAECHDHLFIGDYKQRDFQGLALFVQNASLVDAAAPLVGEKPLTAKRPFASVFDKAAMETALRLPGRGEVALPAPEKGKEYLVPADPKKKQPGVLKFSPLATLADEVVQSPDFARNVVNRVWFLLLGRGIVHPLDLHHAGNKPSHPELLDLLAAEFVAKKYDLKWLVREVVLTEAYQRSSRRPAGVVQVEPTRFLTALERRLSPEQLTRAFLVAVGEATPEAVTKLKATLVKTFGAPPREPEEDVEPSLRGALFLRNDPAVLRWLEPKPGNLLERVGKLDDAKAVEELYLAVLTRRPADAEAKLLGEHLMANAATRPAALANAAWALLAATEFGVNH